MICILCKHEKDEHTFNIMSKINNYCWACNAQWPPKFKTVHDFTGNLEYLEQLYDSNQKKLSV